jgi:hypothetical protein
MVFLIALIVGAGSVAIIGCIGVGVYDKASALLPPSRVGVYAYCIALSSVVYLASMLNSAVLIGSLVGQLVVALPIHLISKR